MFTFDVVLSVEDSLLGGTVGAVAAALSALVFASVRSQHSITSDDLIKTFINI